MNDMRLHQQLDRTNELLERLQSSLDDIAAALRNMRGPYIYENKKTREDIQEYGNYTEENYYE